LVLDRDGGDFYRYYEYRVIRDKKFLGAIRIPAYRRTENFATAEVHLYSDDEKTYTIHPTSWGRYVASRIYYSSDTELFRSIQDQVNIIMTDNMIFNMSYYLYGAFDVNHKIPEVSTYTAYSKLTNLYHQHSRSLDGTKVSLIAEEKDVIIDAAARKETYKLQEQLNQMQKTISQLEIVSVIVPRLKPIISDIFVSSISNSYSATTGYMFDKMSSKQPNSSLEKIFKVIFWEQVERESLSISQQKLFSINWDMAKLLQNKNITPVVDYYNFHKYPKKRNLQDKIFLALDYTLVAPEEHAEFIDPTIGFKLNDQKIQTSLLSTLKSNSGYISENEGIEFKNLENIIKFQLASSRFIRNTESAFPTQEDIDNLIGGISGDLQSAIDRIIVTGVIGGIAGPIFVAGPIGAILGTMMGSTAASSAAWGVSLLFIGPMVMISAAIIRNKVQDFSDRIDEILDDVVGNIEKENLEWLFPMWDWLMDMLFTYGVIEDSKTVKILKMVGDILVHYRDHGRGMVVDAFKLLFDRWAVWIIPILPFPTWVHYTDKWGMIPEWQYKLGIFDVLTLDMNNIMKPEDNPKDISPPKMPPPRPVNTTPEGLEKYAQEWEIIYSWIQSGGLLDTDDLGNFKNITEQEAVSIINYITDLTKQVYIDKVIINEQGEPIYTTDKVLLDKGLVNLLNSDGREYIEQIASFNMSKFKW
ncbi:MAG: hypothetical protein ACRCTQ_05740, partial [Brevinemataceae bacterium]